MVVFYIVSRDVWWELLVRNKTLVLITKPSLIMSTYPCPFVESYLLPSYHSTLFWNIHLDQYLIHPLLIWFRFGFTITLVFIVCLLLLLRRVGSDDNIGHGQKQVTEEGLNDEGMPPSLIILILWFTKLH